MQEIIVSLGIALVLQAIFFTYAAIKKSDKVTDLSYGLTFILIVNFWNIIDSEVTMPKVFLTAMVSIWGARLVTYLVIRINKIGNDSRFDGIREVPLRFARFWLLQGVSVWIILLPTIYHLSKDSMVDFTGQMAVGSAIWLVGFMIETIADAQKFKFKSKRHNKNKWMNRGLWKYSRHPNYFGEILVWWGIFIFGANTLPGAVWLMIFSPFYIMFLLVFVTGIPLLEKKNDERWADNEKYYNYKESTSLLLPLPPHKL
jgi:steroid 5-alpha reductase family enzyme